MITITNNKLYYSEAGILKSEKQLIDDAQFPTYLAEYVEFADNLKFERIFQLLLQNKHVFNAIFQRSMSGVKIDNFLNEYIKNTSVEETGLEYIYIGWIHENIRDVELKNLHLTPHFNGWVKGENGVSHGQTIGLVPMSKLKHCIIKLRPQISVYKNGKSLLKTTNNFTLFNVINAILFEITFHGDPETRDNFKEALFRNESLVKCPDLDKDKVAEIRDNLKEYIVKYGDYETCINRDLLVTQGVEKNLETIKDLHLAKFKIFDKIENTDDKDELKKYAYELNHIEFNLQEAWGFPRSNNYHKFWLMPKCKCPKMDNEERYPGAFYVVNASCPLHGDG